MPASISFQLSGIGTNRGFAKGDATNTQILTVIEIQHFNDQFVVVIHSSGKTGNVQLVAFSPGLTNVKLDLKVLRCPRSKWLNNLLICCVTGYPIIS